MRKAAQQRSQSAACNDAAVLLHVHQRDAITAMAELARLGPYRFQDCWLTGRQRIDLLRGHPEWSRLIVLEPAGVGVRG